MLGEAGSYTLEMLTQAVRLIEGGARFIATNPDPNGPAEGGTVPACGAFAALIEKASGVSALFVGKPNPLMMRMALNYLGVHSENTVMVGDRMDTDVIAGVQTGMETILVLSGVTRRADVSRFPYRLVGSWTLSPISNRNPIITIRFSVLRLWPRSQTPARRSAAKSRLPRVGPG